MNPLKKKPQLKARIKVVGRDSDELVDFVKKLGMESILSDSSADVVVATEEGVIPENCGRLAYPYHKICDRAALRGKVTLSYAIEDNSADVVAKNIRDRDGFITFELLSADGIGRVYIDGDMEKTPKLALAIACGLMLAGVSAGDAIEMVSIG